MTESIEIPQAVKALLRLVIVVELVDVVGVAELVLEHGQDWMALANDICEVAFCNRHSLGGVEIHATICTASEKIWVEWIDAGIPIT